MPDQETIERVQQERHTANHDRLYQATLKEVNSNKPIDINKYEIIETFPVISALEIFPPNFFSCVVK